MGVSPPECEKIDTWEIDGLPWKVSCQCVTPSARNM